jgi:hypothetical protein
VKKYDSLVRRAIRSSDWTAAEKAAAAALAKSHASLGKAAPKAAPEQLWDAGLPNEEPEPDERPVEEREDVVEPDLALDEGEGADETLRSIYADYVTCGGNRLIREGILRLFDSVDLVDLSPMR